jgi:hypothetical protein
MRRRIRRNPLREILTIEREELAAAPLANLARERTVWAAVAPAVETEAAAW